MKLVAASALLAAGHAASQLIEPQLSSASSGRLGGPGATSVSSVASSSSFVGRRSVEHLSSKAERDVGILSKGEFTKRVNEPIDHSANLKSPRIDAGILSEKRGTLSSSVERRLTSECTQGYITCVNGIDADSSYFGDSCADTCGSDCCNGYNACSGFTGKVCRDGNSCNGDYSCYYARVETVINGCSGYSSCWYTGYEGTVGAVHDSCLYDNACGWAAGYGGEVQIIKDSCRGDASCYRMAHGGGRVELVESSCTGSASCWELAADEGKVEVVKSSCSDYYACRYAAYSDGNVNHMLESCHGYKACYDMAVYSGEVNQVSHSCIGESVCNYAAGMYGRIEGILNSCDGGAEACFYAAYNDGSVGAISDSCIGDESCSNIAIHKATIGDITASCTGMKACFLAAACDPMEFDCGSYITEIMGSCEGTEACDEAGAGGGGIGNVGIRNSCIGNNACSSAGFGEDNIITSGISECCDGDDECQGAGQEVITDVCGATTPSPTMAPTITMGPTPISMHDGESAGEGTRSKASKADRSKASKTKKSKSAKMSKASVETATISPTGSRAPVSAPSDSMEMRNAPTRRSKASVSNGGKDIIVGLPVDLPLFNTDFGEVGEATADNEGAVEEGTNTNEASSFSMAF